MLQRDGGEGLDAAPELVGLLRRGVDAAVVRQERGHGLERQYPVQALLPGVRIECHRCGWCEQPGSSGGVKFPVGDAEGVAGE